MSTPSKENSVEFSNARPHYYRNLSLAQLLAYRLPPAGIVSILHRISGALLFFALPLVLLPLLDKSLSSEIAFEEMKGMVAHPVYKLLLLALIWSYVHHFCAGMRFLLLDLHIGIDRPHYEKNAVSVLVVSVMLTLGLGLKLFGVF
ncbi:MAG: succinate dehydrogenase, cytochrome b556 subunit [Burkholderiaceae bacterium]